MAAIENEIKDYVKSLGAPIVGVAGPERFDGPASLDPGYIMRGAKSIVSFAMPMDVNAIYDFLSKKDQMSHNLDQLKCNQWMANIAVKTAKFIKSLGYKSKAVHSNNHYRRSFDVFSTKPDFSHRFGAIVAGIGAHGLSGNILTKEYGAAVYLGTVVTSAELKSDPMLPPRYFIDNYCKKCLICDKACVARMFVGDKEEYVLINGELHPRGKRRDIELCNASCFGLHGLSVDKQWSSWGDHWIRKWVGVEPDPEKENTRRTLLIKGGNVGDSYERYNLIRHVGGKVYPMEWVQDKTKFSKTVKDFSADEIIRRKESSEWLYNLIGVKTRNTNVITCGQCAVVCGPTIQESAKRFKMLRDGGIVVPGKDRRTMVVKTFEEAKEIRKKYPIIVTPKEKSRDNFLSSLMWFRLYWGFSLRSYLKNKQYEKKFKKVMKKNGIDPAGVPIEETVWPQK